MSAIATQNFITNDLASIRDCWLPQERGGKVVSAWQRFNDSMKIRGQDAAILSENQRTYLETQILETLQYESTYQAAIDTVDILPGQTKYTYRKNNAINAPNITQTFENPSNVVVTGTDTTVYLYGMQYDIHLDKVTLDAGNLTSGSLANYSPTNQTNQIDEITRNLIKYWNHWIFWGSDADVFGSTDKFGVKGICNYSGITNITPTDTTLTTAGDIVKLVDEMVNGVNENKIKGPGMPQIHLSPKVFSKARTLYNATTNKSDMAILEERYGRENIIWNPFIIEATAETTSTGAALVGYKLPSKYNKVVMPYRLGYYPLTSTDLGWDAKILAYGGTVLERPEAWAFEGSLTTA